MSLYNKVSPYLSICITTSNRLSYLKTTIESLLEVFNDVDLEIVVVDGASTDGTVEYLSDLMSIHNVHLLHEKELKGNVVAQQTAIDYANGKFILLRCDHTLTIKEPVIDACKLMEDDESIGTVIEKVYNTRKKYRKAGLYTSFLCCDEAFIFRTEDKHLLDKSFIHYFWGHESVLSYLRIGKTVAYLKNISCIDVSISVDDYIHNKHKNFSNKNSSIALDQRMSKYRRIAFSNLVSSKLTFFSIKKSQFFERFLRIFIKCIRTNLFCKLGKLFQFFGYKNINIIPNFNKTVDLAEAFQVDLDLRPNIPFIDFLLDIIYKNCSVFGINYKGKHAKNFFLFQKFPKDLIN